MNRPREYIMPPPQKEIWDVIVKKYKINNIKEYDHLFCKIVTLPAGWVVSATSDCNLDIYNELQQIVGKVYLTESLGFTKIHPDLKNHSFDQ